MAPMKKRREDFNQDVSEDESSDDESFEAPMKKQCIRHRYESSDFDEEEELNMQASFNCTFKEADLNDYIYTMGGCNTDDDVLSWGRYSWRRADRLSRETYKVIVASDCEESKCMELLTEIGCKDRFLGCSVETDCAFYAQLSKEEAEEMQGLNEIHRVIPRRLCFVDV